MFCGKCGAQIDGSKNFCPKCGAEIKKAPEPAAVATGNAATTGVAPAHPAVAVSVRGVDLGIMVVAIVLLLASVLAPLLSINALGIVQRDYGVFQYSDLTGLIGPLTQSFSNASASGPVDICFFVAGIFLVLGIAAAVYSVVAVALGKKSHPACLLPFTAFGAMVAIAASVAQSSLAEQAGAYSNFVKGTFSCTPWVWAIIVISLLAFVVFLALRRSAAKAD